MRNAIRLLALQARLIAEPGGAAAVAAALYRDQAELGLPALLTTPGETPAPLVAVLSGGNIDPALLAEILRTESYTG